MFRTKCKEHDHSSFYQFLQMEHSHKNTDCYFFYYSTCKKGDNCPFRHEPSALGCETMCSYWQQGNCLNEHCNFRHMELKKNRKSIPCYWETQPSGCRKPHCSFLHKNARTITTDPINPVKTSELTSKTLNQEWLNRQDDTKYDGSSTESDQGRGSSEAGSFIGSPAVDPLIVKFEEESDNESVPSPVKPKVPRAYCKTYEEIRLEEIQAESAAYYSYEPDDDARVQLPGVGQIATIDAAHQLAASAAASCRYRRTIEDARELDFEVLTLEEIRRRKREREREKERQKERERREECETDGIDTVDEIDREVDDSTIERRIEEKQETAETLARSAAKTSGVENHANVAHDASRGLKRPSEEFEHRNAKRRSEEGVAATRSVPPVKLRRSPKKIVRVVASSTEPAEPAEPMEPMEPEEPTESTHDPVSETNVQEQVHRCLDRLEDPATKDELVRRIEVQVRLCDSSTSEDQSATVKGVEEDEEEDEAEKGEEVEKETKEEKDRKPNRLVDDIGINEDEYLTLDAVSDDIMSDIDALLKDKPAV